MATYLKRGKSWRVQTMRKGVRLSATFDMSFVISLGMLAGGIIGTTWFSNNRLTSEEVKQLAAGQDFLKILPKLDRQTRSKLVRLIEDHQKQ